VLEWTLPGTSYCHSRKREPASETQWSQLLRYHRRSTAR
jgi:hypothetical protein